MKITATQIEGLLVIEPGVFQDERGYFFESFNHKALSGYGIETVFVQDNESKSSNGVLRGLHYQINPYAQTKLVRVVEGKVWDVAVDLRKDSATFGQWFGIELSGENKKQLYIPRGFAHGFSVLSETAIFAYKCDGYYQQSAERGIIYSDPTLNIDWKLANEGAIVSDKDKKLPAFNDAEFDF